MTIYQYNDYKSYLISRVKAMPHGGRGEYQRIAKYLEISPVVLSQIIKGKRELNVEQGYMMGEYFGFNALEHEYWQCMILLSRSTLLQHKKYIQEKMNILKSQSLQIKNIVNAESLSEEAKSIFYSDWYYSAIRLSVSIPSINTIDKISKYLNMPTAKVQNCVRFLLQNGLLTEDNGKLKRGPVRTQLEADSPFANRYHASWRSKATQNMESLLSHERFLTIPMSLSPKTLELIKEKIGHLTKEVFEALADTEISTLGCLNIDLFEVKK